jgi:hypothetical protein
MDIQPPQNALPMNQMMPQINGLENQQMVMPGLQMQGFNGQMPMEMQGYPMQIGA